MKIITAIENKKINEQLKYINNIEVLNSDIQYKEGILEYLEKNNKLDFIIIKEKLPGEIDLLKLLYKIKKINNKIKTIVLINNNYLEKYENLENVKFVYLEKIDINNILKILNINKNNNNIKKEQKNKIIQILGNHGVGKSTVTTILIKLLEKTNNNILIIEKNYSIINLFKKNNNKTNNNYEIINLKNNINFLNINFLIKSKINILEYLNQIKNNYNFIIIDGKNNSYNLEKIVNKKIYLLEANLLEIEKAKKNLLQNNMEIIINKKNINSIDKKIIENIFNRKILFEIDYDKNINLFINNNFNLNYLSKKTKSIMLDVIK